MTTTPNSSESGVAVVLPAKIGALGEMLDSDIKRSGRLESFMIRAGLLRDILDELYDHREYRNQRAHTEPRGPEVSREAVARAIESAAWRPDWQSYFFTLSERDRCRRNALYKADAILSLLTPATRTGEVELGADFKALHRDYGRAATLINIMRDRWQTVAEALNDIEGGMHADLEDAASAMQSACDEPKATLAAHPLGEGGVGNG